MLRGCRSEYGCNDDVDDDEGVEMTNMVDESDEDK